MKIVVPFLLTISVSSEKIRFEMALRPFCPEAFALTSLSDVPRPEECAKHCVKHQNCSAFGFKTVSNACQLLGNMMLSEPALPTTTSEHQRYYFIREDWCPLEQGFLVFRETGLCLKWIDSRIKRNEALGICNSFDGRLAVLNTERKRDSVFSALEKAGLGMIGYHLGASGQADGSLVWSDGTQVSGDWLTSVGTANMCLVGYDREAYVASCELATSKSICEIIGN